MGKVLNVTFTSSLTDLCELNSSFDTGVLRVCYVGDNNNGSHISEEAINRSLKTIYNCPVVCNYDRETDSIGGHDVEVVKDANGSLRLVNLTQPIGVVPESARVWFDDYEEEDGSVHRYLYTEVLLWKRQEAYQKVKDDGVSKHSMEIGVKEGYSKDGRYYIEDFEFTAFTVIGVQPCFEGSALELFSKKDFKKQLSEMMSDLRESFQKVDTSNEDDNNTTEENEMEGGEKVLDQKMELVAKYGIKVEGLDFSIEDLTVEELEAKFVEMTTAVDKEALEEEVFEDAASAEDEFVENQIEDATENNFDLTDNVVEEIRREISKVKIETSWGLERRYWYVDSDFEKSEVYFVDEEDSALYGAPYKKDGDSVTVDFEQKKRMKWAIVEYVDGDTDVSFAADVFASLKSAREDKDAVGKAYADASANMDALTLEIEELRQFKQNVDAEVASAEREAILSKFEDLFGLEAFEALRGECSDMSVEALEEKCYAIRGRNASVAKFSAETKTPKLIIGASDESNTDNEPYGGVFVKYGTTN